MDIYSVSIGILLLLLFVGPILYLVLRLSLSEERNIKKIKAIAAKYQLEPDQIETSGNLLLGMDSGRKRLILTSPENPEEYELIDLGSLSECRLRKMNATSEKSGNHNPTLTYVSLELLKKNPREKNSEIVFYSEEDDSSYDSDEKLLIAAKWEKLIRISLQS